MYALTSDGVLYSAGPNQNGELGDGTDNDELTPIQAALNAKVVSIEAGAHHACAVDDHHRTWCWGFGRDAELFVPSSNTRFAPQVVDAVSNVAKIAAGDAHTCALSTTNQLTCVGYNSTGQLGDGVRTSQPVPVATPLRTPPRSSRVATTRARS